VKGETEKLYWSELIIHKTVKDCSPQPVLDSLSLGQDQSGKFLSTLTSATSRSAFLGSIPNTSSLETISSKSHVQLSQTPLAWTTHTAPLVLPHKSIPTRTSFIAVLLHALLKLSIFFFLSRRCSKDRGWKKTVLLQLCIIFLMSGRVLVCTVLNGTSNVSA